MNTQSNNQFDSTAQPPPVQRSPWAETPTRICWSYSNPHLATRVERILATEPAPVPIPPYKGSYSSRMQEWSFLRTRNQATNPAKFYASKLNETHDAFLANEIDLEGYITELIAYLEHGHAEQADVLAFLLTIQSKLESGSFCPEDARPKFATRLNKAWEAYQRNNGISPTPVDQQEPTAAKLATIEGTNKLAGIKQAATKEAVESVYASWHCLHEDARAGSEAEHKLFQLVKKVARAKTGKYLFSCDEVAKDADDHSQEVAIKVWEKLPTFKGERFYPWLHKICHRAACDAYKETKKLNRSHVPLMVEVEDEDGEPDLVDNPGIRGNVAYKRGGKLVFQEAPPQFLRELPAFIQGKDLQICNYRRGGYSYEKIGSLVGLTDAGVESRLRRIKAKIEEMAKAKN